MFTYRCLIMHERLESFVFLCLFIFHNCIITVVTFLQHGVKMSAEVPSYVSKFVHQITSCLNHLNRTNVATDRFRHLLQLQYDFELLQTDPEGARHSSFLSFVQSCRSLLDAIFELEMRRHYSFVQHVGQLRRKNNTYLPPQPPQQ
jgi:hypothetical protein